MRTEEEIKQYKKQWYLKHKKRIQFKESTPEYKLYRRTRIALRILTIKENKTPEDLKRLKVLKKKKNEYLNVIADEFFIATKEGNSVD